MYPVPVRALALQNRLIINNFKSWMPLQNKRCDVYLAVQVWLAKETVLKQGELTSLMLLNKASVSVSYIIYSLFNICGRIKC